MPFRFPRKENDLKLIRLICIESELSLQNQRAIGPGQRTPPLNCWLDLATTYFYSSFGSTLFLSDREQ